MCGWLGRWCCSWYDKTSNTNICFMSTSYQSASTHNSYSSLNETSLYEMRLRAYFLRRSRNRNIGKRFTNMFDVLDMFRMKYGVKHIYLKGMIWYDMFSFEFLGIDFEKHTRWCIALVFHLDRKITALRRDIFFHVTHWRVKL